MFFICKRCGVEFEGKQGEEKRIFCSSKCYWGFRRDEKKQSCPHNEAIICHDRYGCFKCGWNPKVEAQRKGALA